MGESCNEGCGSGVSGCGVAAGNSIDVRGEMFTGGVDAVGTLKLGRPELGAAVLEPKARVAALEASGRDLIDMGIFDAGLPSLLGLSVLSILLPFFSGDGDRDFFSSEGPAFSVELLIVLVRLLMRFDVLPELFRDAIEGRVGSGGGRARSLWATGGIDPPPSHSDEAFVSVGPKGTPWGGGVGAWASVLERLSLDSSLLFFSASRRSTRSLHCSSSCRKDSTRALSVSDDGRYVAGLRRALW